MAAKSKKTPKPKTRIYTHKVPYDVIVATYEEGLSYEETAVKLGLSFAQVSKIVKLYGNPRPPGPRGPSPNPERDAEIVRLYHGPPPLTLQQLGDIHGISRERVRQILRDAGIDTRVVGAMVMHPQDRQIAEAVHQLLRVVWPLSPEEAHELEESIELIIANRLASEGYTAEEALSLAASMRANGNGKEE